jgi:hypothetical protein
MCAELCVDAPHMCAELLVLRVCLLWLRTLSVCSGCLPAAAFLLWLLLLFDSRWLDLWRKSIASERNLIIIMITILLPRTTYYT